MKYRYLSIIFLILVLSIGAVCAQDDADDIVAASSDDVISVDNNADVLENELGSGNSISIDDDNYNDYFYENGTILENANISADDTIILGNINDKLFDIDMPLTITSNGTTINDVIFILDEGSDNSVIKNLNINCNDALNNVFSVYASNVAIQDNVIELIAAQDVGGVFAVYAEFADNLNIQANSITYVGKTDGYGLNVPLFVSKSEDVTVEGNYLNITIPSADVDWSAGIAQTAGAEFLDCDGLEFIGNTIELITEASVGMYPTVYVIQIKESDDVLFTSNFVTAESQVDSSYLYALSIQGDNFEISSNEFETTSDDNYVCGIDIEGKSSGVVDDNYIFLSSPFVAYGIYACDWMSDGQLVKYTNNVINGKSYAIYGMELLYGDESVIDSNKIRLFGKYTIGIAESMANGPATITNNDIYVYGTNKDMVDSGDVVPSVTVGIFSMGESVIYNNAITSTGNWTVFNSYGDVEVSGNYLVASELMGDDSVNDTSDNATVVNNIPIADATNYDLTNDTFMLFFDEDGVIRKNITAESLTFIGEFSGFLWNVIDRPINLVGDDAVLYDMSFTVISDNVTFEDFTFVCEELAEVISVVASNFVSIRSSSFNVLGVPDDNNAVISFSGSDYGTIELSTIVFTVETNDTYENRVIFAEESDGLIIQNNDIYAYLPSRSIDWGTGTVYSEGVFLKDCYDPLLDDNTIAVISNDKIGDYDSIYAVHIIGDHASILYNRIGVLEAPYGYAAVITGKDFMFYDNYLAAGENGSYACGIDVESNSYGCIVFNEIVVAGDSAYGIYTADWAGDVKANITNNNINASANTVFGMSLSGSESLVRENFILTNGNYTTGIASVVSDILIDANEIYANGSNVGIPLGYDTMGIQTVGVHVVGGNATVTNNFIASTSDYAVNMSGKGSVTDNELYAEIATGDFAVDYVPSQGIIVANNKPEMDYILTNDTFFVYFNENGYLKDQVKGDNLTFVGEFSNLLKFIVIDKPIKLLGDNATLNDIGMAIMSADVAVDGFNFTGEYAGIVVLYNSSNVEIINNNFVIVGIPDDGNVGIRIFEADDVTVENNTIIFGVETNDTFVNFAVCAEGSDNLIIRGNNITASLPARSIDWTTGNVYSQGVFLDGCDNAVLENNTIGVKSNGQIGEYDSIYAVNIKGDNATVTGNNLGAVEAPYSYALVITGENFNIADNMIYAGENVTYACGIDVESNSNGVIDSNFIYTVADESAYGIYTADWAGDVKANITNNYIFANSNSPFALSLSGSESLVENNYISVKGNYTTGIASVVDDIVIDNNMIVANASNEGTPLGYDMMGIETTGIHIVSGNAVVTDNNVTTTGEFAVDAKGTGIVSDNYLVAAEYTGDAAVDNVAGDTLVLNNTPTMERVVIKAENVVMYYKNGTRYVVKVMDMNGNPLEGELVTLTINGASYTRTTNENGTASIAINLPVGNYTASVEYIGTGNCTNTTIENNITVLTTVLGDNLVKIFRNASQYYATFLDGQGNPLTEGTAVFNINGVMYERKINENGIAKLNINLNPGTYIITAINPENGEMHSNNITVLSSITDNKDLVKYYRNGSQYVVTILGDDGKAVGAGESVTFNINGVLYTRTTNASGQAKLNINLNAGDYVVTADYKGCKVSNNIKVLPVLSAKDLVIKYGTSDQFIAHLVDGQGRPYPGQTVTFNINGVFYQRITDSDGRGILNIRLGAAKDVYTITSSYNGSSISNTITIVD